MQFDRVEYPDKVKDATLFVELERCQFAVYVVPVSLRIGSLTIASWLRRLPQEKSASHLSLKYLQRSLANRVSPCKASRALHQKEALRDKYGLACTGGELEQLSNTVINASPATAALNCFIILVEKQTRCLLGYIESEDYKGNEKVGDLEFIYSLNHASRREYGLRLWPEAGAFLLRAYLEYLRQHDCTSVHLRIAQRSLGFYQKVLDYLPYSELSEQHAFAEHSWNISLSQKIVYSYFRRSLSSSSSSSGS